MYRFDDLKEIQPQVFDTRVFPDARQALQWYLLKVWFCLMHARALSVAWLNYMRYCGNQKRLGNLMECLVAMVVRF